MKKAHDIVNVPEYAAAAAAITSFRERAGVTKTALAAAIGVSRQAIIHIEDGTRRVDVIELARIADALDCDGGALFMAATMSNRRPVTAVEDHEDVEALLASA